MVYECRWRWRSGYAVARICESRTCIRDLCGGITTLVSITDGAAAKGFGVAVAQRSKIAQSSACPHPITAAVWRAADRRVVFRSARRPEIRAASAMSKIHVELDHGADLRFAALRVRGLVEIPSALTATPCPRHMIEVIVASGAIQVVDAGVISARRLLMLSVIDVGEVVRSRVSEARGLSSTGEARRLTTPPRRRRIVLLVAALLSLTANRLSYRRRRLHDTRIRTPAVLIGHSLFRPARTPAMTLDSSCLGNLLTVPVE